MSMTGDLQGGDEEGSRLPEQPHMNDEDGSDLADGTGELPTEDLSNQRMIKLLKIAGPIFLAQMIQDATLFGGAFMLSRDGSEALAASALIFPLQNAIILPPIATLFSVMIRASEKFGESQRDDRDRDLMLSQAGRILQQGKLLALGSGAVSVIVALIIEEGLIFFREPSELVNLVDQYFNTLAWGIPFYHSMMCSQNFANATNEQVAAMTIGLMTMPILLGGGYGLVFGKFGLPELGPVGYAYAFNAHAILRSLLLDTYLLLKPKFRPYRLWDLHNTFLGDDFTRKNILKSLLKIGWPLSLFMLSELGSVVGLALLAGKLSKIDISAQGISSQWILLIFIPMLAIQSAVIALIGRSKGQGRPDLMQGYNNRGTFLSVLVVLMPFIISIAAPQLLPSLFIDTQSPEERPIFDKLKTLLPLYLGGMLFEAVRIISTGSCLGVADTLVPTLINLLTLFILGTIFAAGLEFGAGLGMTGIAVGRNMALVIAAATTYLRWRQQLTSILNVAHGEREATPLLAGNPPQQGNGNDQTCSRFFSHFSFFSLRNQAPPVERAETTTRRIACVIS